MNVIIATIITGIFTLIGVIIGAILTFVIYWYSQYRASHRKLLNRLEFLKHDLQGGTNFLSNRTTEPETWSESFKDIWTLYNNVMDWAPFWKKCKIRKAWQQYKDDIINGYQTFPVEPEDKKDFIHRIEIFIDAL